MKRILVSTFFSIVFFSCYTSAKAQLTIELMDSIAKQICSIEAATNEMTYNSGINDYQLEFPEESFGFYFNNKKAWKVVNKAGRKKYLIIFEEIDFSKALRIEDFFSEKVEVAALRVYFPKGDLKTMLKIDEDEVKTLNTDEYIEFFFRIKTFDYQKDDYWNLTYLITNLVHQAKVSAGIFTKKDANLMEFKFKELVKQRDYKNNMFPKMEDMNNYLSTYDKSLYNYIVQYWKDESIASIVRREQNIKDSIRATIVRDSLCKAFFYKQSIYTKDEFKAYNPNVDDLLRKRNNIDNNTYIEWKDYYKLGPNYVTFSTQGLEYRYMMNTLPYGEESWKSLYYTRLEWLKTRFPLKYIQGDQRSKSGTIHIVHPKNSTCIKFEYNGINGGGAQEKICFSPDK